jgi:hypothetical protein
MSDYNNSHFKTLLKHPIEKLVDLLVETVIKKSPIKKLNTRVIKNILYEITP